VRGDLDPAPLQQQADRPEPLPLCPDRFGDVGHDRLDFVGQGIGREVDVNRVVRRQPARTSGDGVAHRAADEVDQLPGGGEPVDERRRQLEHGTKALGDHEGGG
jgi:hypothetical protein